MRIEVAGSMARQRDPAGRPRARRTVLIRVPAAAGAGITRSERRREGRMEILWTIVIVVVVVAAIGIVAQRRRRAGGVVATRRRRRP